MSKKKKHHRGIGETIFNILLFIPTLFNFIRKLIALISYEIQLAGKSLIKMIILAIILAITISSTWLCLLAMLFFYFISLQLGTELSLFCIVLINILLTCIILFWMNKIKQNLLFSQLRKQLQLRNHEENG